MAQISRRQWPKPNIYLVLLVALAAAILGFYRAVPPSSPWYFSCQWREKLGVFCAGCGAQRGLHALMHGQWIAALGYNAWLFLAALPAAMLFCIPSVRRRYIVHGAVFVGGSALVFCLLRNLGTPLFSWLAP